MVLASSEISDICVSDAGGMGSVWTLEVKLLLLPLNSIQWL